MRSHFKRSLGATLLAGVLLLSACSSDTAAFELTSAVDSQELLAESPAGLTVLDIRTPEEFASGYIAGATNLDFYEAEFSSWLDDLDKDAPYFVYCRSGNRSNGAGSILKKHGFENVYNLGGGITAWQSANLPLSKK